MSSTIVNSINPHVINNNNSNNNRRKKALTNNSGPLVKQVREGFLAAYEKEKDFYYEEDVKKIINDDWFVKRFLLARNRNVNDAIHMIIDAMKWRKSEAIRDLKASYFPDDMFKISSMFIYTKDKEGNLTVYFRVRYVIKITELVPIIKKFGNYLLHQVDEYTNGNGITGVADFQGTGIQNAEIDLLFYAITTLRNYFPAGINRILIVDLPWVLKACWGLAKAWLPENRRKLVEFITRKELTEYIDIDNLPDFMGGNCTVPYAGSKVAPKSCPTMYEFCTDTLNLPPKTAEKISNIYKPVIESLENEQQEKEWYRKANPYYY